MLWALSGTEDDRRSFILLKCFLGVCATREKERGGLIKTRVTPEMKEGTGEERLLRSEI